MIEAVAKEHNAYVIQMSNESKVGIDDVKTKACDILLDYRLTHKSKDPSKMEGLLNRLTIAEPKKRDNHARKPQIPESVLLGVKKDGPTVKELQEEFGGAGVFYIPPEEHYLLEKEEWRYDAWPEFYNGKNVMDFYDPDIEAKLNKLEAEEEKILKMEMDQKNLDSGDEEMEEAGITDDMLEDEIKHVRGKKAMIKEAHKMKLKRRAKSKLRKLGVMEQELEAKGIAVNKETLKTRV